MDENKEDFRSWLNDLGKIVETIDNTFISEDCKIVVELSEEKFRKFQKNKKYSLIIFVAKIEKDGENLEFDIEHLHNSFLKFHANSLYLIASLVKNLNDSGHMVYISSAAVNTNVPHSTYIAGKAMLQAFTISLSAKSKNKQSIYVISPTRILGSKSQIENEIGRAHV